MTQAVLLILATLLPLALLAFGLMQPRISTQERRRWSRCSHAVAILREVTSGDFGQVDRDLCRSQIDQYRQLILRDLWQLSHSSRKRQVWLILLGVVFFPSDLLLRIKSLLWPSGLDLHPLLNLEIHLRRRLDPEKA
ncbi:MAG TPA: hypothetical protein VLV83_10560 [Acidobacteriota bacterium]|nr:hypothetical protein [Acidobacteriota bacterium]